jgi:hypothetical protein
VIPAEVLRELEKLAASLGIDVRFDSWDARVLETRGGLCTLRGKSMIVVDSALPLLDKIAVLSEALSMFDLEAIYVPPVLRARIEGKNEKIVKPLARPLARARAR